MKKIKLKTKISQQVKAGYPLIRRNDLLNEKDLMNQLDWVQFVTQSDDFLGIGYLGDQNKGSGWVLTPQFYSTLERPFFEEKFKQAKSLRQHFLSNDETTAYRMFNGEGDQLGGVTIDIYNQYAVFSWYNETIYHNKQIIIDAFRNVNPEIVGGYEKIRFQGNGLPESQFIFGQEAPEPLVVKENGVAYATYLNEGLMTGIFLDQKEVRGRLVDGLALGRSVLNTFSYTGAFSVAAAMGGAKETVSVDLAKRSLPKTQEMFETNGLSLDNNRIVVMDVFDYFNYAKRKALSFDMIVLDPPSFARSKKRTFSVAKNYGDLVEDVAPLLNNEGILIASTNAANVTVDKYQQMVETALRKQGKQFKQIGENRLPVDFKTSKSFPEGNYLKVLIYQVLS
ncbi:class I SAM-dependent rRNA methyltransferase [Vagococcus coleopterorum]|uniref:Class I SAM-dependent rRNA methyltransferase n=1 Tax=Vagococcus coleopterorum TaxID=2714946 RepID=A0A6G8AMR8_9ENTE|nr:class I SAM-dependent rRNA methyltransferase [Vagococcus coleopterorum]QIL46259.1 class I SAM-dependent rRNA methyltransferase [Vagococcus coleopterorum]